MGRIYSAPGFTRNSQSISYLIATLAATVFGFNGPHYLLINSLAPEQVFSLIINPREHCVVATGVNHKASGVDSLVTETRGGE